MKRFFTILSDLLYYAFSSRFERELLSRPQLDDQAFYEAHYGDSGIPEDIPIRVRKVYVEQLGDCWKGVRPDDNVCEPIPILTWLNCSMRSRTSLGSKSLMRR